MEIFQIFALIIGGLIIAHCFVYLRLIPREFSNLQSMLIFGALSLGMSSFAWRHPSSWIVFVWMGALIFMRMSVCNSGCRIWDFGGYYSYGVSHIQKTLRVILSWITLIAICFISIVMIKIASSLGVMIAYLSVVIIIMMASALEIKNIVNQL